MDMDLEQKAIMRLREAADTSERFLLEEDEEW